MRYSKQMTSKGDEVYGIYRCPDDTVFPTECLGAYGWYRDTDAEEDFARGWFYEEIGEHKARAEALATTWFTMADFDSPVVKRQSEMLEVLGLEHQRPAWPQRQERPWRRSRGEGRRLARGEPGRRPDGSRTGGGPLYMRQARQRRREVLGLEQRRPAWPRRQERAWRRSRGDGRRLARRESWRCQVTTLPGFTGV